MSRPVQTDKWAGNFDCSVCRRKRLVGSEFSKKALEKYRKTGGPLKCKQCVLEAQEKERKAAADRARSSSSPDATHATTLKCVSCQKALPSTSFNRNQISKGEGKARCRACVEKSVANEKSALQKTKEDKIKAAKEAIKVAEAKGNMAEIVQAESVLAALEAEHVTGLKPITLGGSGRGRGRWSNGRGRSGRGRGTSRRAK